MDEFVKFIKDWWAVIAAFSGMFALIWKLVSWIIKSAEKSMEKTVNKSVEKVLEKIEENSSSVATLQHDRLIQAHEYFTERGWIPPHKKQAIIEMFDQYKATGHNHIFISYREDILKLPEKKPGNAKEEENHE